MLVYALLQSNGGLNTTLLMMQAKAASEVTLLYLEISLGPEGATVGALAFMRAMILTINLVSASTINLVSASDISV